MTPNYELAAIKATEMLIHYGISTAPVDPFPIIKQIDGVIVHSFENISNRLNMDRRCVISMFGEHNQDAFTSVRLAEDKKHYLVMYNKLLPFHAIQRGIARELGHIVLGHDGTRPEDVRNEEAKCFALHLLAPRALIHSLQATGMRITTELLGTLTGFNDICLSCLRNLPPVKVPAELNAKVRNQFLNYTINYFEYQKFAKNRDESAVADLGHYMDGYDE